MSNLHGKSVLLGMGIGIILTAFLGTVFFLGYTPEMDKAKVMDLAKKYGMIEPQEQVIKLEVTITDQDSITDIIKKLDNLGIINDIVSFQIKTVNNNVKDKIVPGTYEFNGNETEDEIVNIITGGKADT